MLPVNSRVNLWDAIMQCTIQLQLKSHNKNKQKKHERLQQLLRPWCALLQVYEYFAFFASGTHICQFVV